MNAPRPPLLERTADWLNERLGSRDPLAVGTLPHGPSWRYSTGAVLVYLFAVELVTGLLLMAAYAPAARTAWESVFYIEHAMLAGSLVRGLHHYATHAMIVVAVLHVAQMVLAESYRRPREVIYWLTLALVAVLFVMSQTGYLLPWDQRSLVATGIATRIAGAAPGLGPTLEQLARGGSGFGNGTLTRFYTLHVGVLPLVLIALGLWRLKLQRRHGFAPLSRDADEAAPPSETPPHLPESWFPQQALRDAAAALLTLVVVLGLAITLRAPLGPPADQTIPFEAARPEWWFLPVFRLLHFPGITELVAGHLVPGAIFGSLAMLPFLPAKVTKWLGPTIVAAIALFAVGLGGLALYEDWIAGDNHGEQFRAAVADAERVVELASRGIPPTGAADLLRGDALTTGGRLFSQFCSSCHSYDGHDGRYRELTQPASAPDLATFGQREWVRRNLVAYREQFAPLANVTGEYEDDAAAILEGDMASWCDDNGPLLEAADDDLAALVEYVVSQSGRDDLRPYDESKLARGRGVFEDGELATGESIETCLDCHAFVDRATGEELLAVDDGYAPILTGYAGPAWIEAMLRDPVAHYGEPNAMPAFESQLSPEQITTLAQFLCRDWVGGPGDVATEATAEVATAGQETDEETSDEASGE